MCHIWVEMLHVAETNPSWFKHKNIFFGGGGGGGMMLTEVKCSQSFKKKNEWDIGLERWQEPIKRSELFIPKQTISFLTQMTKYGCLHSFWIHIASLKQTVQIQIDICPL